MTDELINQKCVPCEGGIPPFTPTQIIEFKKNLKTEWQVIDDKKLVKDFEFENFVAAVAFVNKIAELAETQGHHPNLNIHDYKYVTVELYTHKIGGLHVNDFILAAKIEAL
ncbi:MAG: 4a-hydroxytetrahydrobiopterin dehydratase [Patescibacteria group bacterium]|nr:4a-hydroxytetrahydrobiopterin dehydratase [Patescibacteria group bacterium]